jgi:hypothetical protein
MATLAVTQVTPAGVVETPLVAASAADQFPNNGRTYLKVTNGGGSSTTVQVIAQRACDQGTIHSISNTIVNATTEIMGPFTDRYTDANGFVQITTTPITSVTIGCFSV